MRGGAFGQLIGVEIVPRLHTFTVLHPESIDASCRRPTCLHAGTHSLEIAALDA